MGNSISSLRYVDVYLKNPDENSPVSGFTQENGFTLKYTVLSNSSIGNLLSIINAYREDPIVEIAQGPSFVSCDPEDLIVAEKVYYIKQHRENQ